MVVRVMKSKTRLRNVDTELLDEKIRQSGLRIQFIYKSMGLTAQNFYDRRSGKVPFTVSEVFHLCYILKITDDDEKTRIFFPKG
jgi:hypothetical protein